MTALRFFTDEDLYGAIAPALRNRGFDAVSTPEAGQLGALDEDQLAWAAGNGRVLVTFNVGDFAALHTEWLSAGKHHAGIVLSAQLDIGELLKRLVRLAAAMDADSMADRLEFLGDW